MRKYMTKLLDAWHAANVHKMSMPTASFEGKVFYSYDTPIAYKHYGIMYINSKYYSKTTTCQVNAIKEYALAHGFRIEEVTDEQMKSYA